MVFIVMSKVEIMDLNYTYCLNQDTCLHRRVCKRWIGNYTDEEAIFVADSLPGYIDESKCIPDYREIECENYFEFLDRFCDEGIKDEKR